ncbi:hypothetical protein V8C86DRAFT_2924591, partial [Haematococcus lacustris]
MVLLASWLLTTRCTCLALAGCETGCEAGCEENGCEAGCEVRSSHRAASQPCGREVFCRVCGCVYGLDVAASMGNLVRCHRCNTGYTMMRLRHGCCTDALNA